MPQKSLKTALEESSKQKLKQKSDVSSEETIVVATIGQSTTAFLPTITLNQDLLYVHKVISPTESVMKEWWECKEEQSPIQQFLTDAYIKYVLNNDDRSWVESFKQQKEERSRYKAIGKDGYETTTSVVRFSEKKDFTTKEDRRQEFIKFLEHNKKYLNDVKFNWKNFYIYLNEQLNQIRNKKAAQHVYEMFSKKDENNIAMTEQDQKDLTTIYAKIHEPLVYPQFADEIRRLMSDANGKFNENRTKYYLDKIYEDGWIKNRRTAVIVNVFAACCMHKFKMNDGDDLWSKYKKIQALFKEREEQNNGIFFGLRSLSYCESLISNLLGVKKIILGLVMMLATAGLVAAGGVGVASIFFKENEDLEAIIYILGAVIGALYGGSDFYKRMQTSADSTLRMLARDLLGGNADRMSHSSFDHRKESLKFIGIGFGMTASILYYVDTSIEIFAENSKEGILDLDANLYIFLIVATSVLGLLAAYFNYRLEIAVADDLAEQNQQDWLGQTILPLEDIDNVEVNNERFEFQPMDNGTFWANQKTSTNTTLNNN